MFALITAVVMVLFAAAFGRRLLAKVRLTFPSFTEQFVFSAGLGLGVMSLGVTFVGLIGGFHGPAGGIAVFAFLVILVPGTGWMLIDAVRHVGEQRRERSLSGLQRILVAVILVSMAACLVSAFAPPTSWDATASHLKITLRFLDQGDIYQLDDLGSNAPLNAVMLYVPAFRFGSDVAPAVLHWAITAVTALALFVLSRRYLTLSGALVATATFCVMPLVTSLAPEALADGPMTLYVLLALGAFLHWWRRRQTPWLLLAAVNAGFAAGTQYSGLAAVGLLLIGVVVRAAVARRRRGRSLRLGLGACLLALALASPWYVRNAINTGDPVCGILTNPFPPRHVAAAWPMVPPLRPLLPFLIPCLLFVGYAFERFDRPGGLRWADRVGFVAVCLLGLAPAVRSSIERVPVVVGVETREAYLLRVDDVYPMARYAADTLPTDDARVLYVGERMYHFLALGVNARMGMPFRQDVVDFSACRTPADLLALLRNERVTHVIVNEKLVAARAPVARDLIRGLNDHGLTFVARQKSLALYRVETERDPPPPS